MTKISLLLFPTCNYLRAWIPNLKWRKITSKVDYMFEYITAGEGHHQIYYITNQKNNQVPKGHVAQNLSDREQTNTLPGG